MSEEPELARGAEVTDPTVTIQAWSFPWGDEFSVPRQGVPLSPTPILLEVDRGLTFGRRPDAPGAVFGATLHVPFVSEHLGELTPQQVPGRVLHFQRPRFSGGSPTVLVSMATSVPSHWLLRRNASRVAVGTWSEVSDGDVLSVFGRSETWQEWQILARAVISIQSSAHAPFAPDEPIVRTVGRSLVLEDLRERLRQSLFPTVTGAWTDWSVVVAAYAAIYADGIEGAKGALVGRAVDNARQAWGWSDPWDVKSGAAEKRALSTSAKRQTQYLSARRLFSTVSTRYESELDQTELALFPFSKFGVAEPLAGDDVNRRKVISDLMRAGIVTVDEMDLVRPLLTLGGRR